MLFSKKLKAYSSSESGRSMIEMLGVLAIVGVLSIAGIAGYEFAVLKFRVNEIINELNGRAISVSSLLLNDKHTYVPEDVIKDGFGDTLSIGYEVESAISDRNTNYFEISVMNVPDKVCVQLVKSYENPIMIFADDVSYNNDTSICQNESGVVDMSFIYRNDLGEHDKCSARGYFGEEDFKCHCSGNTYIDPDNPLECLCPAGRIWSEADNTCIESICPEGYFESQSNGCVPCSDEKTYTIATDNSHKKLCQACTDSFGNKIRDVFDNNKCTNIQINSCPTGTGFRIYSGVCYPCDDVNYVHGINADTSSSCTACGNRISLINTWCVHEDWCPNDNRHFFKFDTSENAYLWCSSCDTNQEIVIGITQDHAAASRCAECRDSNGNLNRVPIKKNNKYYCGFRNCKSTQFKGADDACYDCSHINPIFIGTNTELAETCRSCSNREVTQDGYCRIKDCSPGTGMRMKDGSCYPCDHYIYNTRHIYLSEMVDQNDCEKCSNRLARDGVCYNTDVCKAGEGWWMGAIDKSICYSCGERTTYCSSYGCELCDSCDNQHYIPSSNMCVFNNACNNNTQFQSHTGNCFDCTYTDKIRIGTHQIEQQHCLNCTGEKRFWAGEYCYRCDSIETPNVITDEERASCLSCSNTRTISDDGKCMLVQ